MKTIILLLVILTIPHAHAAKGDWTGPICEKPEELDLEKIPTNFKDTKIGKIGNAEVWKVYRNLTSERQWNPHDPLLEKSGNCLNLEFRSKQVVTYLNLEEKTIKTAPEQESVYKVSIKNNKVYVVNRPGSRYAEEGELKTYIYQYNEKKPKKVSLFKTMTFLPHTQKQNQVYIDLKKAQTPNELRKIFKQIHSLNRCPTGWEILRRNFFERYTPVFLKKLKIFHSSYKKTELSGLTVSFVEAVLPLNAEEKIKLTKTEYDDLALKNDYNDIDPSKDVLKLWKKLAYYMKLEGQKKESDYVQTWIDSEERNLFGNF